LGAGTWKPASRRNGGLPVHAIVGTAPWRLRFRVIAQLIQLYRPTGLVALCVVGVRRFLPPARSATIILVSLALIVALFRRRLRPNRTIGIVLLCLGGLYLVAAVFRLVAGYTFLSDVPFFDDHLPAYFHILLAGLVVTFGDFIRYGR
jgi:hypothetical protein